MLFLIITLLFSVPQTNFALAEETNQIRIFGLVNRPLNLTYAELLSSPVVSEIINLECVFRYPNVTFNWTGIPLFHLLTLAQVKPEAREVVFRAADDFSSSITIEEALKPYVILALKANGTLLSEVQRIADIEGGFRIVVPCKWGYKWVTNVREIEVVDYDYKGTYERNGFSDEADIPDCTPPSIFPPLQVFDLPFGTRNFQIKVFTNVSINAFNFNYSQKEIELNVSIPLGTTGFADIILQQNFLKGPYSVFINENPIQNVIEANVANYSLIYLDLKEEAHFIKIVGTEFFGMIPEIMVEFNQTAYVGEAVAFDASKSNDDGEIVSYDWDFGDGANGSGPIVYHPYSKEGVYQVMLNVTDSDGLSNSVTLIVNVDRKSLDISAAIKVFLIVAIGLLISTLIILLLRKKSKVKTKYG